MLTFIHSRVATMALLYFFVMGVWGFILYFRKKEIDSNYWGAVMISEILLVVQLLVGIVMWLIDLRPEQGATHLLYGILAPAILPLVYGYTKGDDSRRALLLYATFFLAITGLIIRAIDTGMVPGN